MKYCLASKSGKVLHTNSREYAHEWASMNNGVFSDNLKVGKKMYGRKRKYARKRGSNFATARLLVKAPVKSIFASARKARKRGNGKRSFTLYGLAMKKLGFLQGVHKRR